MSALHNDEIRDLLADADRADDHFATMAEYQRRAEARKADADRRLREAAQTPLWRGGVQQAGLWLAQLPEKLRDTANGVADALLELGHHAWTLIVAVILFAVHVTLAVVLIALFPATAIVAGWRVRLNAREAVARLDATRAAAPAPEGEG